MCQVWLALSPSAQSLPCLGKRGVGGGDGVCDTLAFPAAKPKSLPTQSLQSMSLDSTGLCPEWTFLDLSGREF